MAIRPSASAALQRLSKATGGTASRPRRWVLDIPFAWRAWSSTQGVRWDADQRVSYVEGESLPAELLPFAAQPFSWEWHRQAEVNGEKMPDPPRRTPHWGMRAHQEEAALHIGKVQKAKKVGFVLADEVGTGKTMSSWGFALQQPWAKRVLIVTTAAATAHWRNTLLHAGHGGKSVLVINYDRLGKLFDTSAKPDLSTRAKGKRARVAKQGEPQVFDLIIFDEAHKGKNLTSARSIMMRRLGGKAAFVLWLSATAGQNPLELAYLAPLLAQVTGDRPSDLLSDFEAWCLKQNIGVKRGKFGKWEWERSKAHVAKVHAWLFGGALPVGLRRLPQEIAGWPAMERQLVPVDLEPEERRAYEQAWREFCQEEMGRASGAKSKKDSSNALVARLRFRQKSSWLRIGSTLGMLADHLENGKRVAISVAFHDTLEEMQRLLKSSGIDPAVIHGRPGVDREAERLRFQRGLTPVALFTVEEAISLHQGEYEDVPRVLLVHDLRWSAIQISQIEGRCHRDGMFAPTLWMYANDTVEEGIAEVLVGRVTDMKAMHGDDVTDLEAVENVLRSKREAALT